VAHRGNSDDRATSGSPELAVLRQGGIRMDRDLVPQAGMIGHGNQPRPTRAWSYVGRPSLCVSPHPAANRRGIVPKERSDVNGGFPRFNCSQRSFTDVVGGMRALRLYTVTYGHIIWQPL